MNHASLHRRSFLASSAASLLGAQLLSAAETMPLRVLFYGGPIDPVVQDLSQDYRIEVLKGGHKPKTSGDTPDNVYGLEQLDKADLWIGSSNKRNFPNEEQLAHFRKYLEAGKPFVGFRAASHIFQNWLEQDKAVWGAKYGGHHIMDKDDIMQIRPAPGGLEHPILKGIEPPRPASGSYHYTELEPDVTVLLYSGVEAKFSRSGKDDFQPHTWVRVNKKTGGRAFYTRYDRGQIAKEPIVRQIFIRGIFWALNRDMAPYRKTTGS